MTCVLDVQQLKTYITLKSEVVRAVDEVSFSIQAGETFALIGESGCGKSITALSIIRLLPHTAYHPGIGKILLNGIDLLNISEMHLKKIRGQTMSMIFQDSMQALNPVFTVGEQIQEAVKLHTKCKKSELSGNVLRLMRDVQLPDPENLRNRYPHELSGGLKQRVMIAIALSGSPDLLIADEPTTALDVTIQAQVLSLLKEICKQRDLSILFITHDMAVVSEMADRVAVMKEGKIVEQAACKDFFTHPQHSYTQRLLADARATKAYNKVEKEKEPLIEVQDLKVHFPIKKGFFQRTTGFVKAVDDVSFSIAKGKTLALVGESGSGKSTIGKAILSLLDETEGKVSFEKQNLVGLDKKALSPYRRKIQVVFQDPFSALNPRMTIADIIREGMVSLDVGPKERKAQDEYIEALLFKVDLEAAHMHRYPHEFSGGQRQRIGIARTIALQPKLIVCDESVSALDISVQAQVLNLLNSLKEIFGFTYIFISHDLAVVKYMSDQLLVMNKGKIEELGDADIIYTSPKTAYTKKLIDAIPKGL